MNQTLELLMLGDGDRAAAQTLLETARISIDKQSLRLLASAPRIVQQIVEYFVRKTASQERGDIIIEVRQPTRTDPVVYVNGRLIAIWV